MGGGDFKAAVEGIVEKCGGVFVLSAGDESVEGIVLVGCVICNGKEIAIEIISVRRLSVMSDLVVRVDVW